MENIIYIFDIFGTSVFAISGALVAGKKQMDIFGVVVLACTTAIGGGTLRDIILGNYPVFWVKDTVYLFVAFTLAILTFLFAHRWKYKINILLYSDAIGLAVFTIIGFQKGFMATQNYTISIVMGIFTGVVGGIFRDILSGEIPMILRKEIYASASFIGSLVMVILTYFSLPNNFIFFIGIFTILAIRFSAIKWKLSLPLFKIK